MPIHILYPIPVARETGSEIIKLLVGNNGSTMYALVRNWQNITIFTSNDGGVHWSAPNPSSQLQAVTVYDIAIAPDDPNMVVAAVAPYTNADGPCAGGGETFSWAQQVWISTNGAKNWENTSWPPATVTAGTDIISALDVSMDFGGGRYIMVGTRDGAK